jgi:hypothetical protein
MTARPKQILLWAATGLIWLGAFVGAPTLIAVPFILPLIREAWSSHVAAGQMALLFVFSAVWLLALIGVGLAHRTRARWAHFIVAGLITGGTLLLPFIQPRDPQVIVARIQQ